VQIVNNSGAKFVLVLSSKVPFILDYQMITLLHLQSNGYRPTKYGDLLVSLKV
jgi:hypothetical protein